jgi:hypothetical protein
MKCTRSLSFDSLLKNALSSGRLAVKLGKLKIPVIARSELTGKRIMPS